MKNAIAFASFLFLMAFSCEKEELSTNSKSGSRSVELFIFGEFHCFCNPEAGACATLYKYTPGSLIEGDGTGCNLESFTYRGPSMDADDVALAAALLAEIPDELYASRETTFGCPDCADQGGYYVSVQQNGELRSWRIDTRTEDLPEFLIPFQQKIAKTLMALQQQ